VPNASELVMMVMMNVPATNMQLCSLDLTTLRRMVTENKEHTHIYIYLQSTYIFTHLLVCYFHCTPAYSSSYFHLLMSLATYIHSEQ